MSFTHMLIYQGQFGGLTHWATEVRIVQLKIQGNVSTSCH